MGGVAKAGICSEMAQWPQLFSGGWLMAILAYFSMCVPAAAKAKTSESAAAAKAWHQSYAWLASTILA